MSDILVPVERVAEGLWQTINGIDDEGIAAHYAWVGLPEEEKEQWRARAPQGSDRRLEADERLRLNCLRGNCSHHCAFTACRVSLGLHSARLGSMHLGGGAP